MFVELLMTWESLSPSESLLRRDFLNAFILQGFRRSHFHESAWSKDWPFGILASITYMGAGYHFVIMSLFRCFLSCILGVSWFSILSMVLISHSLYLLDALQSLVLGFWIFRISNPGGVSSNSFLSFFWGGWCTRQYDSQVGINLSSDTNYGIHFYWKNNDEIETIRLPSFVELWGVWMFVHCIAEEHLQHLGTTPTMVLFFRGWLELVLWQVNTLFFA